MVYDSNDILKEGYGYYLVEDNSVHKVCIYNDSDNLVFFHDLDMNGHSDYVDAWNDFIHAFEDV